MEFYHNPRCSKSRQALALLQEHGVEVKVRKYLEDVPTPAELKMVLAKLNAGPLDILRKGEAIYKEKFKGCNFTDEEWIQVMTEYPKLIERPILIGKHKAVVGRPPEKVLEITAAD